VSPACPTCGEQFDTRRGLGVHHSRVHGDRLPNRECDHCGDQFYADYAKKYCSGDCLRESGAYAGENNPNYRGGKATADCERCGTAFEYYPSEKEGLYCRECVRDGGWRVVPELSGDENPRWNGGKAELECAVCGDSFERYRSNVTSEIQLCGEDCRADWLSESFAGEGHPNWAGGDVGPYGEGWSAVRRAALERDGYECVVCGTGRDELGRNPDVHHLVPVRRFVDSPDHEAADAHRLTNVVSLCVTCHRKADVGTLSRTTLCRARR